ncbi:hypothetical protein BH10PSE17_BH10PSE17_15660 [soil metagenome]
MAVTQEDLQQAIDNDRIGPDDFAVTRLAQKYRVATEMVKVAIRSHGPYRSKVERYLALIGR